LREVRTMPRISMTKNSFSGSSRTSQDEGQITEMIKKKAYELYEKRGRKQGHAVDDWLEAERIVRSRAF